MIMEPTPLPEPTDELMMPSPTPVAEPTQELMPESTLAPLAPTLEPATDPMVPSPTPGPTPEFGPETTSLPANSIPATTVTVLSVPLTTTKDPTLDSACVDLTGRYKWGSVDTTATLTQTGCSGVSSQGW